MVSWTVREWSCRSWLYHPPLNFAPSRPAPRFYPCPKQVLLLHTHTARPSLTLLRSAGEKEEERWEGSET